MFRITLLSSLDPRRRGILALGLTTLLVVGCSSQTAPQTTPALGDPTTDEPDFSGEQAPTPAIEGAGSARLLRALDEYRAGVELIAADDTEEGRRRLEAARLALLEAASACSTEDGCSPAALATTTELLLSETEEALLAQADRIRQLEALQEVTPDPRDEALLEEQALLEEIDAPTEEIGSLTPAFETTDSELGDWLTLNAKVEAEMDDWLTWRRPMLIESWVNYQYLKDEMAPIYAEADFPEALLFAMLATESGAKVHASSRAGALGPLQFMSYTGRRYGLSTVDGFDLRQDPAAATRANVAYLKEQLAALGGDLELALAAYNGGENRMRGLHRRYPGASFWDHRIYYSLPRETRHYVPRILAAARLFSDPDHYNLRFPQVEAQTEVITAARETSVGELAICLGSTPENPVGWFRTVRNLNPRFDANDRIEPGAAIVLPQPLVTTYRDHCLEGDLLTTAHALYQANYPPEPEMIRYRVARGDTLSRIASRHRCASLSQISSINRIRGPRYTIRVGQTLKIPACR